MNEKIRQGIDRRLDVILDRLYNSSYLDDCRRNKRPFWKYLSALGFFMMGMVLFGFFALSFYLEGLAMKKESSKKN